MVPIRKAVSVKIDIEVHEAAKKKAAEETRSFNNLVEHLLKLYCEGSLVEKKK